MEIGDFFVALFEFPLEFVEIFLGNSNVFEPFEPVVPLVLEFVNALSIILEYVAQFGGLLFGLRCFYGKGKVLTFGQYVPFIMLFLKFKLF